MTEITKTAPVGYLFQMTCDTGNGKHLTLSGNFGVGVSAAEMNTEVDKLNQVFDRLRAQHEMPLIAERLDGTREQLASQEADLENYLQSRGEKAQDKQHVYKMRASIAAIKVAITKGEIAYAQAQLKAK